MSRSRTPAFTWLSKRALLLLHEESLAEYGGVRGFREEGLLDSALARPQHILVYQRDVTLAELTAAYAFGITRNHPFVDGNKRAAFLALGIFLEINGWTLEVEQPEAILTIRTMANGDLAEKELATWIERHITRQAR